MVAISENPVLPPLRMCDQCHKRAAFGNAVNDFRRGAFHFCVRCAKNYYTSWRNKSIRDVLADLQRMADQDFEEDKKRDRIEANATMPHFCVCRECGRGM